MAMVITKFNKLIANKFVWIGFTILIVLAFVALDMSIPEEARNPSAASPGTLHGKPVSSEEFRNAYVHTYMAGVLSTGRNLQITPDLDAELTNMAWKRLVSLQEARAMGFRISNREVVEAIRNFDGFQQNNQFSPAIYQSFVQQFLPGLGFSAAQFEDHVRQELLLQKLQRMVADTTLVTPTEIERAVRSFGDAFTVEYALIDESVLGQGITARDEQVEAFFAEHRERFAIPPKVQVRYVRLAIEDFEDGIEVTEEQALEYYDRNIDRYVREEKADAEAESDLFAVTTTLPFEAVQEEVIATLRRELAAQQAADTAMELVISLVPDRMGVATTFEAAAAGLDLEIYLSAPFSRHELVPDVDAGLEFTRTAFDLQPNPEYYFSDAIIGQDHLYIMALQERFPSYLPEIEEVRTNVQAMAERVAVQEAIEQLAQSFKEMAEASSFAEAAEQLLITTRGPVTFTPAEGLEGIEYGQELLRAVLSYNPDELSEPVNLGNAYLVAYVTDRVVADPVDFMHFRPQIVGTIASERARILLNEWQEQLLRQADFQPRVIPASVPYEDADDEWDLLP